jgi:hypothetical protein
MIRLTPDRSDDISRALRKITRLSLEAELARDTDAARTALTAVRDAVLEAGDLINRAEREARNTALLEPAE